MGYAQGQSKPMTDVHGIKVNGGSLPAAVFSRFMTQATRGADAGDFPKPGTFPGKVIGGDRIPFATTTTGAPPTTAKAPPPPTAPRATAPPETTTTGAQAHHDDGGQRHDDDPASVVTGS